jgi:DNA-binding MarR family transcriptional regulator
MSDEERRAAADVRRGASRLTRRLRIEGPPGGLSTNKLNVLSHLRRWGPLTPGQLASLENVQPQSLTRLLAELEDAGMIRRRPSNVDRRQSVIEPTDHGVAVLASDMAVRDQWLAEAMADLGPAERAVLEVAGALMEQLADKGSEPIAQLQARSAASAQTS